MLFLKIVAAHLANQKQGGVLLPGQVALCQFQSIVVVSAGQALVSRNHHKPRFPVFLGLVVALDIPVLQVRRVAEDVQNGLGQPVKIGSTSASCFLAFFTLAEEIKYMALVIFSVCWMLRIRLRISVILAMWRSPASYKPRSSPGQPAPFGGQLPSAVDSFYHFRPVFLHVVRQTPGKLRVRSTGTSASSFWVAA